MAKRRAGRRDQWTAEDARRVLAECARSGLTVQAFARSRGLTSERLYWWQRRLREEARTKVEPTQRPRKRQGVGQAAPILSLVPAVVASDSVAAAAEVLVRLPSEVVVEVRGASPSWVASLVRDLTKGS